MPLLRDPDIPRRTRFDQIEEDVDDRLAFRDKVLLWTQISYVGAGQIIGASEPGEQAKQTRRPDSPAGRHRV